MKLSHLCLILAGTGVVVLGSGLLSGLLWPGVVLLALALLAGITLTLAEYLAAQRRAVVLEAMGKRLELLEASEKKLRAEVDVLNRRSALNSL